MLNRTIPYAIFALFLTAFAGCSSSTNDDSEDNSAQVTAVISGHGAFNAESVFVSGTAISFSFSAVDDDYTVIISIQSPDGEPLPTTTYMMGENSIDGVTYFASGSVVADNGESNIVMNAQAGGDGKIILESFSAEEAKGKFGFDARSSETAAAVEVREGMFKLKF